MPDRLVLFCKVRIYEFAEIDVFHRLCEIISLNDVAPETFEHYHIVAGFNAFLCDFRAEFFQHADNAFEKCLVSVVRNALAEEEFIEFDLVHFDSFENVIRRIPRTKVVYRT
mgnify:CR=1 FL=1